MKRNNLIRTMCAALLLLLPLSTHTPAGEGYKCTAPTQECLDKMTASLMKRGWLGIFGEEVRKDGAMYMAIVEVVPDSPAEAADIRPGDILVAINGVELLETNKEKLYQVQKKNKPGVEFRYTILRKKRRIYKKVELGSMPYEVIVRAVGQHMLEHATVDISLLKKEEKQKGKKK
jgi:serine protease Do